MNEKTLYKLSLALPIVVPAICYLVKPEDLFEASSQVAKILEAFVFSGLIGGIPYLIFVAAFLIWMRKRDLGQIRKVLFLSPLILIPIFFLMCLIIMKILDAKNSSHTSLGDYLRYIPPISGWILLFGYFYVLVTFGIARIVRRRPFGDAQ